MADEPAGFLSRWARRKEQARTGVAVVSEPPPLHPVATRAETPATDLQAADPPPAEPAPAADPLPTLSDVALLTRESDYSRFMAAGVDEGVKRAAMKKLFADPHFNVMDGLDTYIGDYASPDPLPLAMLRQMNQSKFLRLFDEEETTEPKTASDDHPDLRLQQDDAAGRPGPDQGTGA